MYNNSTPMCYTYLMDIKECKNCSKDFSPNKKEQVYFSRLCFDTRGRLSVSRVCIREGCEEEFTVSSHGDRKKYCSSSCSAIVSNTSRPKKVRVRPDSHCKDCGIPVLHYRSYCDEHKYGFASRKASKIESWLSGEWDGSDSEGSLNRVVREYVLDLAGFKCSDCGFDTPHPVDGTSILEIDHIDGNGINHAPDNLRVLCPNCHALTPTYRARNRGKGREYRRQHYVRKTDRS